MANSETGWPADGIYWLRKADYIDVAKVEAPYLTGLQLHGRIEGFIDAGWEFISISPSDAEQLSELRRTAEQFVNAYQGKEHQLGNGQALRSFLRFQELLTPKQPEKETR